MSESTGDDLRRAIETYDRWNTGSCVDEDYPTTSEASDARALVFDAVPRLLALVAAQAEQIAELQQQDERNLAEMAEMDRKYVAHYECHACDHGAPPEPILLPPAAAWSLQQQLVRWGVKQISRAITRGN